MIEEQKVLAADIYDTVELTSLMFGGIGAGYISRGDAPFCLIGHIDFAAPVTSAPLWNAFRSIFAGPISVANNIAVRAINRRKDRANLDARVTWEEYTRELNIVRGAS